MKQTTYILIFILLITSCKSKLEDENIFPKVKNVNELTRTDFTPTLESSYDIKKNTIYGATIPFAWNEIRNEIDGTLSDFSSKQLEEINKTKSYENVLEKDEYEISTEINGYAIKAIAYFRKSLPFDKPLTKFDTPLNFNNIKVESFGFLGYSEFVKLNYFIDENEFSISLFPKNEEHEIILIMHHNRKNDFSDFKKYFWRYNQQKDLERNKSVYFNEDDKVEIPIIEFNLEKSYNKIIGSFFKADLIRFEVTEAYQQNAFILNEKGAEIESEAVIEVKEANEEFEKPKPKMMIFNKPFVIFLKRKDAEYPYFGVYIANEELLKQIK